MAPKNLLDLEVEVLVHILEFVDGESARSTAAVAQVCKHLNFVAELFRHHYLSVHWGGESWIDMRGRPQELWETPELLRGLRHLEVCRLSVSNIIVSYLSDETAIDSPVDFKPLEGILRNTSNLKTLSWKVGYLPPHEITEILDSQQPNAQLKVYRALRLSNTDGLSQSEKALAASSCLTSLSMTASVDRCIQSHMAFQAITAMSRNLKFASLISQREMDSSKPDLQGDGPSDPDLWFHKDLGETKPNRSLRHLTLDGWVMSAETLQYWSRYIHLASLESFKSSRGNLETSYFERAANFLPNLKHLSLNLRPSHYRERPGLSEAIEHYIANCPPLVTLSLWSWRANVSLSTILAKHGPTLTDLHLHEREDHAKPLRQALSLQELQLIKLQCPQLKTFTCDLNRASAKLDLEDYAEILEELRQFKLEHLQIYLDGGLPWLMDSIYSIMHSRVPQETNSPPQAATTLPNNAEITYTDIVLPGACEGDRYFESSELYFISEKEWAIRNGASAAGQDTSLTVPVHPPSSNIQICRFLIGAWKAVFGSQTTGQRLLELKFGEWERKGPIIPDLEANDGRVWCRARPHQRDDKQGTCFVQIDCCRGEHSRQFYCA